MRTCRLHRGAILGPVDRIPRHFHFLFGLQEQPAPFHLVHYLCLESCLRINQPDALTVHCHHEPVGRYWDLIRPRIRVETVRPHPLVDDFAYNDRYIASRLRYAHHADFLRLEILNQRGGVYADIDTLFLHPLPDRLFQQDFVLGREADIVDPLDGRTRGSLCNALMLARAGSRFGARWMERMPAAFDGRWSNHSCQLAHELAEEMPETLHIEPSVSFYPFMWTADDFRRLFEEDHPFPETSYSVHLWAHLWWDRDRTDFSTFHAGRIDERHVRRGATTYSRAARAFLPPARPFWRRWFDRL